MENASKALLISGGVLISILVVSLFIYAYGKISEYQTYKQELTNIEDLAKFNEQFTAYDRQDLQGHEVFSLINKVIDYNERYTTDSNTKQDSYKSIKMNLSFVNESNRLSLTHDNTCRLFGKDNYSTEAISATGRNKTGSLKHDVEDAVQKAIEKLVSRKCRTRG